MGAVVFQLPQSSVLMQSTSLCIGFCRANQADARIQKDHYLVRECESLHLERWGLKPGIRPANPDEWRCWRALPPERPLGQALQRARSGGDSLLEARRVAAGLCARGWVRSLMLGKRPCPQAASRLT